MTKSIDKEIEIVVDNENMKFTFESHVRGFHFYQTVWSPIIGNEDLEYRHEKKKWRRWVCNWCYRYDFYDLLRGTLVGHIPQNISKFAYKLLQLPVSKLYCRVTRNTLNKGLGYNLKTPITNALNGHGKATEFMKFKIYEDMKVKENLKNRCLK